MTKKKFPGSNRQIGSFQNIKIQLDIKVHRTQKTEMNKKHDIQFPLLASSWPHCQAEF